MARDDDTTNASGLRPVTGTIRLRKRTRPRDLWERAIRSLGVEPTAIAPAPGIH